MKSYMIENGWPAFNGLIDDEGNGESTGRARLIDPSSFEFID